MPPSRRKRSKYSGYGSYSTRPSGRRAYDPLRRPGGKSKKGSRMDKMLVQDLTRANQIQLSLLPKKIPAIPGFDIKVHYVSCQEIGGDYYDFIEIDKDHLGIIIADISGKGIPGAMIMTMARSVIRLLAENNPDARDTIVRANRIIAKDIKNVMFLTVLYMVLNKKTRTLQVVNAGHNPLIYWDGEQNHLVNPSGIAVGFDLGPLFEANLKSAELVIEPGDRIVAYTDGVVECMNSRDKEYGEDRLMKVMERSASDSSAEFLNDLINDINSFRGKANQFDDITIVTLDYRKPSK